MQFSGGFETVRHDETVMLAGGHTGPPLQVYFCLTITFRVFVYYRVTCRGDPKWSPAAEKFPFSSVKHPDKPKFETSPKTNTPSTRVIPTETECFLLS